MMKRRTIRARDGILRATHSDRIERYLGSERAASLSAQFRDWYGPPVHLADVPGSVRIAAGGDFVGPIGGGQFLSGVELHLHRLRYMARRLRRMPLSPALAGAGFASVSDALARASGGFEQLLNGTIQKTGPTGVSAVASSLWRVGAMPAAGSTPSAAPGGRAPDKSTTGAMAFNNPAVGTLRLTGGQMSASVINNALMLYDRIFDVTKTMNSSSTEAVTGVPTRYQSSTATDEDYAGGNFLFPEVGGTALAATAHNHTVVQYRDEAGNDAQTLPSIAGVSGAIVDRFDLGANAWFMPLASGDAGIKDLAQLQVSAAVATGVLNYVIGHPIAVMAFPIIPILLPFNWLTGQRLAPRIFADACLALIELPKPATTATSYSGILNAVSTSS